MKIDSYEFGKIVVDGKEYTKDLIIFQDRLLENWWRKEGHNLRLEDIKLILDEKPEVFIVGKGYYGYMEVSSEVRDKLRREGIRLIAEKTVDACKTFNELIGRGKKAAAALHLTC